MLLRQCTNNRECAKRLEAKIIFDERDGLSDRAIYKCAWRRSLQFS